MTVLVKRSAAAIFCDVDGDVVALNVDKGQCYGLDQVGATIWGLLDQPISQDAICAQLLELYQVEEDCCRSEVSQLIETLVAEGLVEKIPA